MLNIDATAYSEKWEREIQIWHGSYFCMRIFSCEWYVQVRKLQFPFPTQVSTQGYFTSLHGAQCLHALSLDSKALGFDDELTEGEALKAWITGWKYGPLDS